MSSKVPTPDPATAGQPDDAGTRRRAGRRQVGRYGMGLSDIAWTLALLVLVVIAATKSTPAASSLLSLVMIGSLLLRQRAPMVMLAIAFAAGLAMIIVDDGPGVGVLAVPLVAYSVARWVPGREARWALVAGAIGAVLGPLAWTGWPSYSGMYLGASTLGSVVFLMLTCAAAVATPYAAGRRVLESHRLADQRAAAQYERQMHALADREQQIRIAETTSRAQIARELHDIVAHSLSVMIVQAEGARALATKRPEVAVETLDTIAESGREALGEMRRIVAVLRKGPQEAPAYSPSPGLADIPDLVAHSATSTRLITDPQLPVVPQTLGLTAYRVVQEALTNVLRHAGPGAHAVVTLQAAGGWLYVEVSDDGRGAASVSDGQGNGLRGMRERVESMDGRLMARPRPGGGFIVRAELPIREPGPTPGLLRPRAPQPNPSPYPVPSYHPPTFPNTVAPTQQPQEMQP